MEGYILEWLNLLGRWIHIITGTAWIGASFYFIWLDNHLQEPEHSSDKDKGVGGEIWAVHGGGFYNSQKYQVAPEKLPETLHWFKWEAYSTWLSGMFMLVLMYWYSAELYLIDPNVMALPKPVAILIGIATIVVGWKGYDALCRSKFGENDTQLSIIIFVLTSLVAFLLCQVFSGRGAFIHYGAMLGTIMVGNVAMVIIPGQKDLVKAKEEGRAPDPIHGIRGKQRSVHNTYFTLPVLFVMISNHYAMTYGHKYNWLVLIGISLIGALVRVYFVNRHKGKASPLPIVLSVVLLAVLAAMMVPRPAALGSAANAESGSGSSTRGSQSEGVAALSTDEIAELEANAHGVVLARCAACHAQTPSQKGFVAPPKNIVLETPADLEQHADVVYQQSVVTRAMPLGNLTGMTDEEREWIANWYRATR